MIISIFGAQGLSDSKDSELVASAQQGDRAALEDLIRRHQLWIYNIALRMVGYPPDAEDVTQEILIKMMTKLSTFQGKSSFRTWLYRIVANHVINMKKRGMEYVFSSFDLHGSVHENFRDDQSVPALETLVVKETQIACMSGMLLCLNREQRLVFILGSVLGIQSEIAAEILELTPANFRQKLSRTRKQLGNYMNEKCGLMNKNNPCSCARKTKAAIQAGYVDPEHLVFYTEHVQHVQSLVDEYGKDVKDALELRTQNLFREQPFRESADYVKSLEKMLEKSPFQEMMNFN